MTPEAALATLQGGGGCQSGRRRCAPITRRTALSGPHQRARDGTGHGLAQGAGPAGRIALAQGLWASDIYEARIAAAKLFLQARIRPDDTPAWACLGGLRARFRQLGDRRRRRAGRGRNACWPIPHGSTRWRAGRRRITCGPAARRWSSRSASPNRATRGRWREARDRVLGWCAGYAGRSGMVHPEGRRLVGAGPVEKGPRARAGVSRGPRRAAETLGAEGGGAAPRLRGGFRAETGPENARFPPPVRPAARPPEGR
jgi:hypothetical protein